MSFFNLINQARRRTIQQEEKEENVFGYANRVTATVPQLTRPSFSGVQKQKMNVRKKLAEQKRTAREEYINSILSKDKKEQRKKLKDYNAAKKAETKYADIRKEIKEERFAAVKKVTDIFGATLGKIKVKSETNRLKGTLNQGAVPLGLERDKTESERDKVLRAMGLK